MNRRIWQRISTVGLLVVLCAASSVAAAPRTVTIKGSDDMKYSVTKIQATPGEELRVVLTVSSAMAKDAMAHNFVLLDPSADVNAFVTKAAVARKTGFIPASLQDKVLVHTDLAGAGETVEVTFKAPTQPGTYVYVCTFPGHFVGGMQGQLIVK